MIRAGGSGRVETSKKAVDPVRESLHAAGVGRRRGNSSPEPLRQKDRTGEAPLESRAAFRAVLADGENRERVAPSR